MNSDEPERIDLRYPNGSWGNRLPVCWIPRVGEHIVLRDADGDETEPPTVRVVRVTYDFRPMWSFKRQARGKALRRAGRSLEDAIQS